MPEKPSRRDRRRTGQRPLVTRRPRPAPPVSPNRLARRDEPTPSASIVAPAAPPARPPASATTSTPGPRSERRGAGIGAARIAEAQREERVRKEAFSDLRRIAMTAALITVLLAVAAVTLR